MSNCPTGCPQKFDRSEDVDASSAKLFEDAKCFKDGDLGLNIFASIERLRKSLEDLGDNLAPPVNEDDSNLLHIHVDSQSINNEDTDYYQKIKNPFNHRVIGIAFSFMAFPGGAYFENDKVFIQAVYYTNFTGTPLGAVPFGPIFEITKANLHREFHDDNIAIIPSGVSIGYICTRESTYDGDVSFEGLDMFLKVKDT